MSVSQETRPMRRLPDSSPRISSKIRFPILFFLGIDLALIGLLAVVWLTPLHPNYPVVAQVQTSGTPRPAVTVNLPTVTAPATVHSAPVSPVHTTPAHRAAPATHRPSAVTTTPQPTVAATTKSPRPTATATPTGTPTSSPS